MMKQTSKWDLNNSNPSLDDIRSQMNFCSGASQLLSLVTHNLKLEACHMHATFEPFKV